MQNLSRDHDSILLYRSLQSNPVSDETYTIEETNVEVIKYFWEDERWGARERIQVTVETTNDREHITIEKIRQGPVFSFLNKCCEYFGWDSEIGGQVKTLKEGFNTVNTSVSTTLAERIKVLIEGPAFDTEISENEKIQLKFRNDRDRLEQKQKTESNPDKYAYTPEEAKILKSLLEPSNEPEEQSSQTLFKSDRKIEKSSAIKKNPKILLKKFKAFKPRDVSSALKFIEGLTAKEINQEIDEESFFIHILKNLSFSKDNNEVISLLLKKGANIYATDNNGMTSLMIACQKGEIRIARELIDKGANIYARDNQNCNPLIFLLCQDDLREGRIDEKQRALAEELALYLLENDVNLNIKMGKNYQTTPFSLACQAGMERVAKKMIEKGHFSIEATYESNPLQSACDHGMEDIALFLIKKGADINSTSYLDSPPLILASQRGLSSVVKELIDRGANTKT